MQLIDIGANLTHESFATDRESVIERARQAGIAQLIVTGSSVPDSAAAAHLARQHPGRLFATAGVHPHHAAGLSVDPTAALKGLEALLALAPVVAVGECGLDYYRDLAPRAAQRRAFELQLGLAADSGKPLFLHQREAHADFVAMLRSHGPRPLVGVAHCFTGDAAQLETYLELGLHIGLTGWLCDERRGGHLRTLAARIPPERLLVETDAPYLLPRDLRPRPRSRRNEPATLAHIAREVAQARGESLDQLAAVTSANARALFALPPCE